jgi:hypothetical protein
MRHIIAISKAGLENKANVEHLLRVLANFNYYGKITADDILELSKNPDVSHLVLLENCSKDNKTDWFAFLKSHDFKDYFKAKVYDGPVLSSYQQLTQPMVAAINKRGPAITFDA